MGFLKNISDKIFASDMKQGAEAASEICVAAETGDFKKLQKLFKDTTYEETETIAKYAMAGACEAGQKEIVHFLIDFGVPPDVKLQGGKTPSSCAASGGHTPVLELLHDYIAKAGGKPDAAMVKGKAEEEMKRRQKISADAPNAVVLQRDIKVREKPLRLRRR